MENYLIKRELVKPEIFPKEEKLVSPKEGEKFVYSVDIKYGVQNTDSEKSDSTIKILASQLTKHL